MPTFGLKFVSNHKRFELFLSVGKILVSNLKFSSDQYSAIPHDSNQEKSEPILYSVAASLINSI